MPLPAKCPNPECTKTTGNTISALQVVERPVKLPNGERVLLPIVQCEGCGTIVGTTSLAALGLGE